MQLLASLKAAAVIRANAVAVLLMGSRGRGWQQARSDLLKYWTESQILEVSTKVSWSAGDAGAVNSPVRGGRRSLDSV